MALQILMAPKFTNLSQPVIGSTQTASLLASCWDLKNLPNMQGLLSHSKPV
jgi:hypothetical protein